MVRYQPFLLLFTSSLLLPTSFAFVPSNHPALIVPRHHHHSSRLFIQGNSYQKPDTESYDAIESKLAGSKEKKKGGRRRDPPSKKDIKTDSVVVTTSGVPDYSLGMENIPPPETPNVAASTFLAIGTVGTALLAGRGRLVAGKEGREVAQQRGGGTRAKARAKTPSKLITRAKTPSKQAVKKQPFQKAKKPSKQNDRGKTPSKQTVKGRAKIPSKKSTRGMTPSKQTAKKPPFQRAKTPSKQSTRAKTPSRQAVKGRAKSPSKQNTRAKTPSKQTTGDQQSLNRVRFLTVTLSLTLTGALLLSLFATGPSKSTGGSTAVVESKAPTTNVAPVLKEEKSTAPPPKEVEKLKETTKSTPPPAANKSKEVEKVKPAPKLTSPPVASKSKEKNGASKTKTTPPTKAVEKVKDGGNSFDLSDPNNLKSLAGLSVAAGAYLFIMKDDGADENDESTKKADAVIEDKDETEGEKKDETESEKKDDGETKNDDEKKRESSTEETAEPKTETSEDGDDGPSAKDGGDEKENIDKSSN